jgi:hypothetical protein
MAQDRAQQVELDEAQLEAVTAGKGNKQGKGSGPGGRPGQPPLKPF